MHCFSAIVDVNNSLCRVERKLDGINKPNLWKAKRKKNNYLDSSSAVYIFLHYILGKMPMGKMDVDPRILEFLLTSSTENDNVAGFGLNFPTINNYKIWKKYMKQLVKVTEH